MEQHETEEEELPFALSVLGEEGNHQRGGTGGSVLLAGVADGSKNGVCGDKLAPFTLAAEESHNGGSRSGLVPPGLESSVVSGASSSGEREGLCSSSSTTTAASTCASTRTSASTGSSSSSSSGGFSGAGAMPSMSSILEPNNSNYLDTAASMLSTSLNIRPWGAPSGVYGSSSNAAAASTTTTAPDLPGQPVVFSHQQIAKTPSQRTTAPAGEEGEEHDGERLPMLPEEEQSFISASVSSSSSSLQAARHHQRLQLETMLLSAPSSDHRDAQAAAAVGDPCGEDGRGGDWKACGEDLLLIDGENAASICGGGENENANVSATIVPAADPEGGSSVFPDGGTSEERRRQQQRRWRRMYALGGPAGGPGLGRSEERRMASLAGATAYRTGESSFQIRVDFGVGVGRCGNSGTRAAATTASRDATDVLGNPDLLPLWCDPIRDLLVITRSSSSDDGGGGGGGGGCGHHVIDRGFAEPAPMSSSSNNGSDCRVRREYEGEWVEATTAQLVAPQGNAGGYVHAAARSVSAALGFPTYGRIQMFVERRRGQVGLTVGPFPGGIEVSHRIKVEEVNGRIRILDDVWLERDASGGSSGDDGVCLCGVLEALEQCFLPQLDDYMDQVLSSMTRLRFLIENGPDASDYLAAAPTPPYEGSDNRAPLLGNVA